MPFCQVLDLQHQESWEVDLPGTHRQETLQETPSYAQVRTAAIRLCKPSHTTTISLMGTMEPLTDRPVTVNELGLTGVAPMSRHQDSCSLLEGQQTI